MTKAIASHNGLQATERACHLLQQGSSPLDACVEGVTLIEDDPDELTVGYGGLPNEDGIVELDAAVMDGRTHRGGAVAGLRDVRHAARVARLVMAQTRRVLLVGEGARQFALANGFPAENLLTERARQMWMYWKRTRSAADDWIAPPNDQQLDIQHWFEKHFYGRESREGSQVTGDPQAQSPDAQSPDAQSPDAQSPQAQSPQAQSPQAQSPDAGGFDAVGGTVHCAALDAAGDVACVTSTSGHAFKIAGRVGDSPVLGAGLYVDNSVGTCGAIGHGEATMQNLSSFDAVRRMADGADPTAAGLAVLRQVVDRTPPSELDHQGRPLFNLQLFLLAQDGRHAGVSIWSGKQLAISDSSGTRLEDCTPLLT